jgi:hypothetical protein
VSDNSGRENRSTVLHYERVPLRRDEHSEQDKEGEVYHGGVTTTKREAQYVSRGLGRERCKHCSMFLSPDRCSLVEGEISPQGWCRYFEAKADDDYASGGKVTYERVTRGYRVPNDVIDALGGNDRALGACVMADIFNVHFLHAGVLDHEALARLGDGDPKIGKRVLQKFITGIRREKLNAWPA